MRYIELHPHWKLETRQDLAEVVTHLIAPLAPYYSTGGALVHVEGAGHSATKMSSCVEGFSRVLWGLAPLLAGGFDSAWVQTYQDGLRAGTDPEHPEYWGEIKDRDQCIVEMAAIGYALLLRPDLFWEPFSTKEKENLYHWLNQVNHRQVVDNNWNFFRVIVDLAFDTLGLPYDTALFESTLERIETMYRADGWYKDGAVGTYDYYNGWAFQFYSMLYYKHRKEADPVRCARYRERVVAHAQQLKVWFTDGGEAIPMGRSLIYRFAQNCFFGALAYADIEAVPWGECKRIVLQNFRFWLAQDILDRDGVLSLGYTYPNVFMTEDYNSPTSPYWAFKACVPDDHPFWASAEELLAYPAISVQKTPGFLVQRMDADEQIVLLSGKQYRWTDCNYFFSNFAEKYGKFAYSTRYGFSIARGINAPSQAAFDSTLALAELGDDYYRVRAKQTLVAISEAGIISQWNPWNDVSIHSLVIPFEGWHVRVHRVDSARPLQSHEGGFCVEKSDFAAQNKCTELPNLAKAEGINGTSVVVDLLSQRKGKVVHPEANTNVMMAKTLLPTLSGTLPVGVSWLACAVLAAQKEDYLKQQLAHEFSVQIEDNRVQVFCDGNCIFDDVLGA